MKPDKKICGAKNRKGGKCQRAPMVNGRCHLHGGLSTGPKKGSQNAKKHGIYSQFYTDEEAALINDIEIGKVDDELKLLRIRLHRLLTYEAKNRGAPELKSIVERLEPDLFSKKKDGPQDKKIVEQILEAVDYDKLIDQTLARIGKLEQTKLNLAIGALTIEKLQSEIGALDHDTNTESEYVVLSPDEDTPKAPIL